MGEHASACEPGPPLTLTLRSRRPLRPAQVFRVTYPHQESLSHWDDHGAALASTYAMPRDFFFEMFPFHLLLAQDCSVLQVRRGRLRGCGAGRGRTQDLAGGSLCRAVCRTCVTVCGGSKPGFGAT